MSEFIFTRCLLNQQITDKAGIRMGSETLLNFQQIVGVEEHLLFYFLC